MDCVGARKGPEGSRPIASIAEVLARLDELNKDVQNRFEQFQDRVRALEMVNERTEDRLRISEDQLESHKGKLRSQSELLQTHEEQWDGLERNFNEMRACLQDRDSLKSSQEQYRQEQQNQEERFFALESEFAHWQAYSEKFWQEERAKLEALEGVCHRYADTQHESSTRGEAVQNAASEETMKEQDKELESHQVRLPMDTQQNRDPEMSHSESVASSKGQAVRPKPSDELGSSGDDSIGVACDDEGLKNMHGACELTGSVWNIALFIGHPALSFGGSVSLCFLFAINLTMQITFVIICLLNFRENDFDGDSVNSYTQFRTTVAHNSKYMDTITGMPLAERVCDLDLHGSLELATGQATAIAAIDTYLHQDGAWSCQIFAGRLMCILSIACWLLTVTKELQSLVNVGKAIMALPTSDMILNVSRDGDITLEGLSRGRRASAYLIGLARVGILIMLAYGGCMWLAYTYDVEDLLLNAVALVFVLSVHELLFEALAPAAARTLIAKLKPLPMPPRRQRMGVDFFSVAFYVASVTCATCVYVFAVVPMVTNMVAIKDALCEGNLDFTYGEDALEMVFVQFSGWSRFDAPRTMNSPRIQSVWEAMDAPPPVPSTAKFRYALNPMEFGEGKVLKDLTGGTMKEQVNLLNRDCLDILDMYEPIRHYLEYLGPGMGMAFQEGELKEGTACSRVKEHCHDQEFRGFATRFSCSRTCKCDRPDSRTFSHRVEGIGCPDTCYLSPNYMLALKEMNCVELSPAQLIRSEPWKSWAYYVLYMENNGKVAYRGMGAAMLQWGCDFTNHLDYSNGRYPHLLRLCNGLTQDLFLRPLSVVCPVTCGCTTAGGDKEGCQSGPYDACQRVAARRAEVGGTQSSNGTRG